ncbi:unnamed protein product [Calypogeia fissa]
MDGTRFLHHEWFHAGQEFGFIHSPVPSSTSLTVRPDIHVFRRRRTTSLSFGLSRSGVLGIEGESPLVHGMVWPMDVYTVMCLP